MMINSTKEQKIQCIQKSFFQLDLFATIPSLRYRGKPYTGTICLGVLSIILLFAFLALFIYKVRATLMKESDQITFTRDMKFDRSPRTVENVMIGIAFLSTYQGQFLLESQDDIGHMQRYLTMQIQYWDNSTKTFKTQLLTQCNPDQWKVIGQNYLSYYKYADLDIYYCLPSPLTIQTKQVNSKFYSLNVKICDSSKYACKNQSVITNYLLNAFKVYGNSFPIFVKILSQEINIKNVESIQYQIKFPKYDLGGTYSLSVNLYYDGSEVETDYSYVTFSQSKSTVLANSVGNNDYRFFAANLSQPFFILNGVLSPTVYLYSRQFTKIDDILSYVGGLFGITVFGLIIVLRRYDQIRYQLNVAESSFNFNSDGQKFRSKQFNPFIYVKYLIFKFIQFVFKREPSLLGAKEMSDTIDESVKVLDVQKVIKRIEFMEKTISQENDEKLLKCMAIQEPNSIQAIKKKRNILEYYRQVVNLEKAASFQDATKNSNQSFKYLDSIMHQIQESNKKPGKEMVTLDSPQYLRESFCRDLKLNQQSSQILSRYPLIAHQAKEVHLDTDFIETEKQITASFLRLNEYDKYELIKKMPIIVLNRIRMRAKEINQPLIAQQGLSNPANEQFASSSAPAKIQTRAIQEKKNDLFFGFFWTMDMFSADATLRIQQKPEKATFWFGLFNIIIIALFVYYFGLGVSQMASLDSKQMTTSRLEQLDRQPKTNINNLMYAVKFITEDESGKFIDDFKIQEFNYYFTFVFFYKNNTSQQSEVYLMQPCKPTQWSLLGDQYEKQFNQYELSKALCFPDLVNINSTEDGYFFSTISVIKCKNQTNSNATQFCKSPQIIQQYYNKVIEKYKNFPIYVYQLVPEIIVDSADPIKYSIRVQRFAGTDSTTPAIKQEYSPVDIQTDRNFWPIASSMETVRYYNPTDFIYGSTENSVTQQSFYAFYYDMLMTSNVQVYNRQVNKIDDLLSYIGGLFGFVTVFFAYFVGSYNEYRYELGIGENFFSYTSDGKKIRESYMNFWTYIKFSIFDWIVTVCCYEPKWKRTAEMNDTREQVMDLIDTEKLFRRLEYIENVIWLSTNKSFLNSMALLEQKTINQSCNNRNILDYFNEVIKLKEAATVQDAIKKTPESFQSLKDVEKKLAKKREIVKRESIQLGDNQNEGQLEVTKIKQSFMADLGLNNQISAAISEYPIIAEQAMDLKLSKQFLEVEEKMTNSFLSLSQQQKLKLIDKIPILILHRLRLRAIEMKKKMPSIQNLPAIRQNQNSGEIIVQ